MDYEEGVCGGPNEFVDQVWLTDGIEFAGGRGEGIPEGRVQYC